MLDFGIANYDADETPHTTNKHQCHQETVLKNLNKDLILYLEQTQKNITSLLAQMKKAFKRKIEISSSKCEKLLGIKIDSKLTFDSHVKYLCKKASQKLDTLLRVAYQFDFNQKKLLLNTFITLQSSYIPVAWMFHSHKQNHLINRIHERALRVVYEDHFFI